MAQERMPKSEIPAEMRQMAEQSVKQARKALNDFMAVAQQAVSALEGQAAVAQAGVRDTGKKAMMFAEENVANAFEFAHKLVDKVQKLFEDAGLTDEHLEQLAATFRCCVDEQVMQELGSSLTFMKEQVQEELVDQLDQYLYEMFSELEQRLDESNDRIADMIYLAADSKSSDEFIERAAASARETASDRGHYHNADDVPDSESEANRTSLRPNGGRNFGAQGIRESTAFDPRIAPYMDHAAKHGSQAMAQQTIIQESADEIDPKVERYIQHAEKMAELYPERK